MRNLFTNHPILFILVLSLLLTGLHLHGQLLQQVVPMSTSFYGTPAPGVMFITPISLDTADYPSALAILDEEGLPVFYKPFTQQSSGPYLPVLVTDFKMQPSGFMSYGIQRAPGDMIIFILDTNFVLVDSIKNVNDVATDSHDFIHLQDGTYHLVGTEERILDCSALLTSNGIPGSVNATVIGNVIQRFNPDKTLVFEWRSLDHFNLEDVYSHYYNDPNHLDHSHYNSLDIDTNGNYLLSFRHLNEITKVNASSGDVVWRLGGKSGSFTFTGDTMPFSAQHDARRISNGHLTLFDNGLHNSTPGARGVEYDLDEEELTATAVWQFPEPNGLPSVFIGSTRRLENGNTLIDWGGAFPLSQSVAFTEVDPEGNVIMEIDFLSDQFVSYRAIKQELSFTLPRPIISCDGENMTLTAASGHSFYEWNTGAQTQSIVIEDTGTYQVWVNQGIGYICSEPFIVDDLENICGTLSVKEQPIFTLNIFPNPASNGIFIETQSNRKIECINLYDPAGRRILHLKDAVRYINVSDFDPGVYMIEIKTIQKSVFRKLILTQ